MSKRVIVETSDDDEPIQYVLGSRTKKFLPTFLAAYAGPFWQNCSCDVDEESSDAEIYLLERMCTTPGTLDVDGILAMIEQDEDNHLPIMEALCCLLGYDIDMEDVESSLESEEEIGELRRIVNWLPKWEECGQKERLRASKKAKVAEPK